jgi:hypothetical protein
LFIRHKQGIAMNRLLLISQFIVIAAIYIAGCTDGDEAEQFRRHEPAEHAAASVAGLSWMVPEGWRVEQPRPMRVATYGVPPAAGDTDHGEVAVFYFGPHEGGSVEANVQRWFDQFEQSGDAGGAEQRESRTVNDIPVTIVRTSGTYTAAGGPMAARQDVRKGYKLIGAIAEGPDGAVFFKFTGPERTVEESDPDFLRMIESIGTL